MMDAPWHRWGRGVLDQEEIREHIRLKRMIELLLGDVDNTLLYILHGVVVDQYIDFPERFDGLANDRFAVWF